MAITVIMQDSRPDGAGGTYKKGSTYSLPDPLATYFLDIGLAKRTSTRSEQTGAAISGNAAGQFPSAPALSSQVPVTASTTSSGGNEISIGAAKRAYPRAEGIAVSANRAKRRAMVRDMLTWCRPVRKSILDPRLYGGMANLTNGQLTVSYQSGNGGFYDKSIRMTLSGAGSGVVNLPIAAASETAMGGGSVNAGADLRFVINCSDWTKVGYLEIHFCQNGSVIDRRDARLVWGGKTQWGCTDPTYSAAWNGKFRTLPLHAATLSPAGNPAPWGQTARYFNVTSIRLSAVVTAAVTFDIGRIDSEEWPVGIIVPMLDGSYDSAVQRAIPDFLSQGMGCGGSIHTMIGGKDPDAQAVADMIAAGLDVVPHMHGITAGAAAGMTGVHTLQSAEKFLLEQVQRINGFTRDKVLYTFHFQNKGQLSDTPDYAQVLRRMGIVSTRGNTTDAEYGVNPDNATYNTLGHYYHTWTPQRGRYNVYPLQFYNNMSNSANYDGAPTTAGVPTLRDYVATAAVSKTQCWAYCHEIVDAPTTSDNTPAFWDGFVADCRARQAAGDVVVLGPEEATMMTYGRTDDIVLRWDGEWVYRHDPTTIAL